MVTERCGGPQRDVEHLSVLSEKVSVGGRKDDESPRLGNISKSWSILVWEVAPVKPMNGLMEAHLVPKSQMKFFGEGHKCGISSMDRLDFKWSGVLKGDTSSKVNC